MDLRERLNRLSFLGKADEEARAKALRDLRQRLERVLEPKKVYRKKFGLPIETMVRGEVISTSCGETFQAVERYSADYRHGEMALSEILTIPTYPAHLLSRDEQLKGLDLRKTLFLDTETTGLAGGTGTFAFMIGLGFFEGDEFVIRQLFMRDYSEEKASLSLLRDFLGAFRFLITFNGKLYDIPLLETRFILTRTSSKIREMPNFDLLYPSRKIWKGAYENCRLLTLESQLLGLERVDDVPSEWIPYVYFDYLRTGDGQRIQQVFYHNRMDILSMVALTGRIHLVYHDPHAAQPRKGVEHFALGRLFWDHGRPEKAIPCLEIAINRCDEELAWEVMKWLSLAYRRTGQIEKARSVWEEMERWPYTKDIFPYVELAKYYEHRVKDLERALAYVEKAFQRIGSDGLEHVGPLLNRKKRLELKKGGLEERTRMRDC